MALSKKINRDIKYVNRDFDTLKTSLVEYSKTYFPTTYNDFGPNSPGSLFMEMSAYVGDVLSFYLDNQIQETFLQYARQESNLYDLAYMMGYKPQVSTAAVVDVEIFQQVPSKQIADNLVVPDFDYALLFSENTSLTSTTNSTGFIIEDSIDFSFSSSQDPTEISVYQIEGNKPTYYLLKKKRKAISSNIKTNSFTFTSVERYPTITIKDTDIIGILDVTDSDGNVWTEVPYLASGNKPAYYLLKKKRKAISSNIKTNSFTFTSVERYPTITIKDTNIIGILDVTDSDGNVWTEVPYLAQETIFEPIKNKNPFSPDPNSQDDVNEVPYLLRLKKVPRRFVSRFTSKTELNIQFGASTNQNNIDETIIPNPDNVGIGLPNNINKTKTAFNPSNFLFSGTYGIAPSNTTLTVRYLKGGGVGANVESNTINTINNATIKFQNDSLTNTSLAQTIFDSVEINNPSAASGGSDGDSVEEIRNNSLANMGAQQRTVTEEDYLIRTLSLPPQYGTISKAYIEPEKLENLLPGESQSSLNLYILGYNNNKQLKIASNTLKRNLITYLSENRTIGDSIKIKDAFIINIGIDFDIIVLPNFNNNEVVRNCITAIQEYFNINNQQINQPIYTREIFLLLDRIPGVQTVNDVNIINKVGVSNGYSQYGYDIKGATKDKVIYPSLDPCIFEIKYPSTDIRGRVTTL